MLQFGADRILFHAAKKKKEGMHDKIRYKKWKNLTKTNKKTNEEELKDEI